MTDVQLRTALIRAAKNAAREDADHAAPHEGWRSAFFYRLAVSRRRTGVELAARVLPCLERLVADGVLEQRWGYEWRWAGGR